MESNKILFIEDTQKSALPRHRRLRYGMVDAQIDVLHDSRLATDKISDGSYQLVIMDHQLPHTSSLATLKDIRSKGYDIPVVLVSEHDTEEISVHAFDFGTTQYSTRGKKWFSELLNVVLKIKQDGSIWGIKKSEIDELTNWINELTTLVETYTEISHCNFKNICQLILDGLLEATGSEAGYVYVDDTISHLMAHKNLDVSALRSKVSALNNYKNLNNLSISYFLETHDINKNPTTLDPNNRLNKLIILPIKTTSYQRIIIVLLGEKPFDLQNIPINNYVFQPEGKTTNSAEDISKPRVKCNNIDKKRLQEQLIYQEKMAALGIFSASIVHDIKNPLDAIVTSIDCLLMDIDGADNKEELKKSIYSIKDRALKISTITRRLLNYSKGSVTDFMFLDINTILQDVLFINKHQKRFKSINIEKDLRKNLPKVWGNYYDLERVFYNILDNAIDAIDDNGQVKILTKVEKENYITIRFIDDGKGIPQAILSKVFEPFFSTKNYNKGTGLGLYICSEIIKTHGGEIEISSKSGEGAIVSIMLPFRQCFN